MVDETEKVRVPTQLLNLHQQPTGERRHTDVSHLANSDSAASTCIPWLQKKKDSACQSVRVSRRLSKNNAEYKRLAVLSIMFDACVVTEGLRLFEAIQCCLGVVERADV